MGQKTVGVGLDILVIHGSEVLLSRLSKKWLVDGKQLYGVPGRDIRFGEKIGDAVKRTIREEIGCTVTTYKIISVNANYAWGNHYVNVGVVAEIAGDPHLLHPEDWDGWQWFAPPPLWNVTETA